MADNKAEALKVLKELRKNRVQEFIEEKAERSADVIHRIVESEDAPPIVRLNAAKDILDRAGYKPVERIAVAQIQPITGMKFVLDNVVVHDQLIEEPHGTDIQDKE